MSVRGDDCVCLRGPLEVMQMSALVFHGPHVICRHQRAGHKLRSLKHILMVSTGRSADTQEGMSSSPYSVLVSGYPQQELLALCKWLELAGLSSLQDGLR